MPPPHTWVWLVDAALSEDLGPGDATSEALIPEILEGEARIEAREALVIAGVEVAGTVFARSDVSWEAARVDGSSVKAGTVIGRVRGPARGILASERTALNFLQRLSGIATLTRRFCEAVSGTSVTLVDTRKTTPGWRALEKYAVRCGGGTNHRMGLYDGILIKDNHISAVGSVADAVKLALTHNPAGVRVQVEVESPEQARRAIEAGADALLIDNQAPPRIAEIVEFARAIGRGVLLEASGGVTLETVTAIAGTGVDRISIGALTHSAPATNMALEWNVRFSR
jgi:nicotinate-nucleotide pyrophosphorylase (carboxylating)